jgi:RhtB (resistance to homoserine/threonine) family protein
MPDTQHLLLFIAAGWLLNFTPGPDVLCIITNSLRSGAKAGVVAGAGIMAGCFVHIFAAALGLGVLLAASATAFTVLKYAGAAYLLWVGIKILFSRAAWPKPNLVAAANEHSLWAAFLNGFLTNVLNPKVALFFLAFMPQFIAPEVDDKALVFVLLGVIFNLNAIPVNFGWAYAAAWMARRNSIQRGMRWLDRAAACMFIGFGLKLALADAPGK